MIDFSLLLPTRERPLLVRRALDSIASTAADPRRLEVIVYADQDDLDSQQITHPQLAVQVLVGPRARMGVMLNACFEASQGRIVMLMNDDVVFQTNGWDRHIRAAFAQFADQVALVWGNDLCSGSPAHPFLSRAACHALQGVCPNVYHREFIDTHLLDVFRKLRALGHDRMVYLSQVIIEHLHVVAGKANADATYDKPRRFEDERLYILWEEERLHSARELAAVIQATGRA